MCAFKREEDLQINIAVLEKGSLFAEYNKDGLHTNFGDVKFYLELKELMRTCGYQRFSVRDIHLPTYARLRSQLSALINYAKFQQDLFRVYDELVEPVRISIVCVEHCGFFAQSCQLNLSLFDMFTPANCSSRDVGTS